LPVLFHLFHENYQRFFDSENFQRPELEVIKNYKSDNCPTLVVTGDHLNSLEVLAQTGDRIEMLRLVKYL
jgi:hypothetical protein